ncbi:MAG: hypothetical protein KZQ75_03165 [Candidatus Thiodiazotropha sp. (ex Myrtea spinifera)]|nr:hypothetical protein [Candidatus Thiodiazotropha sp. (ex Myrtea spinifera)]
MNRILTLLLVGLAPLTSVYAEPWQFEASMDVATVISDQTRKVFHHLDSSGRRNIAVSSQGVVVAWEDDRDDTPRIYLAYKTHDAGRFEKEVMVSGDGEAYEPSLVALTNDRFVVAWEEDGHVLVRVVDFKKTVHLGPVHQLSEKSAAQVHLTTQKEGVIALWSERAGRYGQIRLRRVSVDSTGSLRSGIGCPVDVVAPTDEQLYPSATLINNRLVVAWEDRRPKHTIIMAAVETEGEPCRFGKPERISEKPDGRNLPFGAGHGVSRVVLGRYQESGVFAAWADKRDFRDGYDIWGADFSHQERRFGSNVKVQDDFGGLSKQRHATLDGHANGMLVVAWDDEREGHTDVALSWLEAGEWSDDWLLPVASGEGEQSNPSIVLDENGNLHIAWVERTESGGATRLKYAFGKLVLD